MAMLDDIDDLDEAEVEEEQEAVDPPVGSNRITPEMQATRRAAWRRMVVEFCKKARHKSTVRVFAKANMPYGVADEVVNELVKEGLIEQFAGIKGPMYRAAGVKPEEAASETEEQLFPGAGAEVHTTETTTAVATAARAPRAPKETSMAKDDEISPIEAAKLLGISASGVTYLVRKGKLKGRKANDGARSPIFVSRAAVDAYAAARANPGGPPKRVKAAEAKPRRTPAVKRARSVARSLAKSMGDAMPGDQLRRELSWLVLGVDLGKLSQDEAFAKVREMAAEG